MADLVLGCIERIIKAGWAIRKAVATVHQNKDECRNIQRRVDTVIGLISLQQSTMGAVMAQEIIAPLDDLAESVEKAFLLITDCKPKSALRHLFAAGDMAKKLRRVQDDINEKLILVSWATAILNQQTMVCVKNTLHYVGTHPPPLLPQVAGEVSSYDSNLGAIEMRSGVNSNTIMVATGNVVPHASSSRVAEFNWSERESTLCLSLKKHISEGGHAFVLKQEIVIRVVMRCDRCRSKARELVAALGGVDSYAFDGEFGDRLKVVGQGVDAVKLISAFRKEIGPADLLNVGIVRTSSGNRELPARQRFSDLSSGSSSDSDGDDEEEEEVDPRSSSSKGKGKQSLQVARPHVAIRSDGSSLKGSGCFCSFVCFANHE